jgi:hypothetical protein
MMAPMDKQRKLFVVTPCCSLPARVATSRVAAVRALGNPADVRCPRDRQAVADFLEGRRDDLHDVTVGPHFFDVVPAEELP